VLAGHGSGHLGVDQFLERHVLCLHGATAFFTQVL
jgi:hypothetical protein